MQRELLELLSFCLRCFGSTQVIEELPDCGKERSHRKNKEATAEINRRHRGTTIQKLLSISLSVLSVALGGDSQAFLKVSLMFRSCKAATMASCMIQNSRHRSECGGGGGTHVQHLMRSADEVEKACTSGFGISVIPLYMGYLMSTEQMHLHLLTDH